MILISRRDRKVISLEITPWILQAAKYYMDIAGSKVLYLILINFSLECAYRKVEKRHTIIKILRMSYSESPKLFENLNN